MSSFSNPNMALLEFAVSNSSSTLAAHPKLIDAVQDRWGTGNRRMANPILLNRGLDSGDFAYNEWSTSLLVPAYTRAIGVRALCSIKTYDSDADPDANALLKYSYDPEDFVNFLTFDKSTHGVHEEDWSNWIVHQTTPWNSTPPNLAGDYASNEPLDVTASDSVQELTIYTKLESDEDINFLGLQFFFIPYTGEFPNV